METCEWTALFSSQSSDDVFHRQLLRQLGILIEQEHRLPALLRSERIERLLLPFKIPDRNDSVVRRRMIGDHLNLTVRNRCFHVIRIEQIHLVLADAGEQHIMPSVQIQTDHRRTAPVQGVPQAAVLAEMDRLAQLVKEVLA